MQADLSVGHVVSERLRGVFGRHLGQLVEVGQQTSAEVQLWRGLQTQVTVQLYQQFHQHLDTQNNARLYMEGPADTGHSTAVPAVPPAPGHTEQR